MNIRFNIFLIQSIFFMLCINFCSAKGIKKDDFNKNVSLENNLIGEWKYVDCINFGVSVILTDQDVKKRILNERLVIKKNIFMDNDEKVSNPKYVVKIITNKKWAMEPEPEEISYSSGFMTNRIVTKLIKVYDKNELYTQFELLDNGTIMKILDNKGFILKKYK